MRATATLAAVALASLALGACGGKDFENKPRPPVTLKVTGVITKQRLTISPARFGAGPVAITISNQTTQSHTITLQSASSGGGIQERVGPINPLDTATLQKTLDPGRYTVRVGTARAVPKEITPATLVVGKKRASGSNTLLLP